MTLLARLPRIGLGLAALGRPGYINLERSVDLADRSVEAMQERAFVVLDAATFGFMLICVVVSQQLLYRLGDGTYGHQRFGTEDAPDARDSALGRLTTQYGFEFRMARLAFGLGLVAILLATVVKTWASPAALSSALTATHSSPPPSPPPVVAALKTSSSRSKKPIVSPLATTNAFSSYPFISLARLFLFVF